MSALITLKNGKKAISVRVDCFYYQLMGRVFLSLQTPMKRRIILLDIVEEAMITTPIFHHPYFSKPFTIEINACQGGVGAILSQEGHPIAFFSSKITGRMLLIGFNLFQRNVCNSANNG